MIVKRKLGPKHILIPFKRIWEKQLDQMLKKKIGPNVSIKEYVRKETGPNAVQKLRVN